MGSDTFYNKRRFLWGVMRFVWAVSCVRTAPRPVGAAWVQAQPAGLSLPGSACPPVRAEGILKEEGKNPLLAAKKVGGAAGGALYWILITR